MANTTHAEKCDLCPAGFYCLTSGVPLPCLQGFYCPAGTGKDLKPCPRGTLGLEPRYQSISDCQPCPSGKYCQFENATTFTGNCQPGHWCGYGVDRPSPLGKVILDNTTGICYNDSETGYGGVCPVGHFCKEGAQTPEVCPIGTYGPREGLSSCYPCMAGYYCPFFNMTTYDTHECPKGHFCINGTATIDSNTVCPKGTFSNKTKNSQLIDCDDCSSGKHCSQTGFFFEKNVFFGN